jgi:signal transduction histidine kinase
MENTSYPARPGRLSGIARTAAVAGPACVVLLLGVLAQGVTRRALAGAERVEHAERVARTAEQILLRLTEAETAARGYVLSGDQAFLAPAEGAGDEVERDLAALRTLIRDPQQRERVQALLPLVSAKLAVNDSIVALMRSGDAAAAAAAVRSGVGKEAMEDVQSAAREFDAAQQRVKAVRDGELRADVRRLTGALAAGTLLAVALALLTNLLLARHVRVQEELASDLEERNRTLEQQAAEIESQAEELQEQASYLEETAAELEVSIEELNHANDALRTARADADEANRAKTEFLTAMSHELRTPLNAIAGYVDLLSLGIFGPVTAEQANAVERIRRNQRHLLGLITDILNFAKIEMGKLEFHQEALALAEVLAGIEAMIEPQVRAAGLTYVCSPGRTDLRVWADRERTEQILLNLLTNAVKFTPSGGRVEVSAAATTGCVEIRVQDTGRGIPADKIQKIFDPFVQVDRERTPSSIQGIGLGLSICRGLAHQMGGEIEVESAPGSGSTFVLALPEWDPATHLVSDGIPAG